MFLVKLKLSLFDLQTPNRSKDINKMHTEFQRCSIIQSRTHTVKQTEKYNLDTSITNFEKHEKISYKL